MRRLTPGQRVALDLECAVDSFPCSVASVTGNDAILNVRALAPDTSPSSIGCLTGGSLGYLVFTHRGAVVGLRGVGRLTAGDGEIHFSVTDGIQLPERRAATRTAVCTRVVLTPLDDEREIPPVRLQSTTLNVSLRGMLIARPVGLGECERSAIELYFGHDETPVRATAVRARATDTLVAVKFDQIEDDDLKRLGEYLIGHRIASGMDTGSRGELSRPVSCRIS